MKRNFLLMLLLTLLPLVSWAADVPVLTGLDVYSGTKGWVIGSQDLPGAKVGETAVDAANITYYDSEGLPVTEITKVGWYFAKVVYNNATTFLPFPAWKEVEFEYIDSETAFNNSVSNGALKLYYEQWTPTEAGSARDAWLAEQNSFKVAAARLNDKTKHGTGFPWVVFKSTEAEPCRVMFAQRQYEWDEDDGYVADNYFTVNEPWGSYHQNSVFFSTTDKTYGVASMPEELNGANRVTDEWETNPWINELYWDETEQDDGAYVNNFAFFVPTSDLKVYFTPASINAPAAPGDLVIKLDGALVEETSVDNFPNLEAFFRGGAEPVDVVWSVNTGTDAAPAWATPADPIEPGYYRATYTYGTESPEDFYAYVTVVEANTVYLNVIPKTDVVMPYGKPFTLDGNAVYLEPNDYNSTPGLRDKVAALLKVNENFSTTEPGLREFTIGLKTSGENTILDGLYTYIVNPTGKGAVDIQQGTNELVDGWDDMVVMAEDLVFNGFPQNLVVASDYTFNSFSAAEEGTEYAKGSVAVTGSITVPALDSDDGEITYTGIKVLTNIPANGVPAEDAAWFVDKTFYVIGTAEDLPEGRLRLYTKAENENTFTAIDVWVEVENTQLTTYAGAYQFYSIRKAEYDAMFEGDGAPAKPATPADYEVPEDKWGTKGALPTGTNAGEYYVWVKAADGGLYYTGDDQEYVGTTTIAKATPIFTGTIAVNKSTYYYYTGSDPENWNNLREEIVATANLQAHLGEGALAYNCDVTADDVIFYVQKGTKNGDTYTYAFDAQANTEAARRLENYAYFTEGRYRIIANYFEHENLKNAPVANNGERIAAEFDVVKPTVEIQTLVKGDKSAIYAYDAIPLAKDYDWEVVKYNGYNGSLDKDNIEVSYKWFRGELDVTNEAHHPVGTYTVYVEGNFNAGADFGAPVIKPATVIITATNILAAIEDQTLVFGQELPLKLKYSQGAFTPETEDGAAQIKNFENIMWPEGFVAKNKETGEEINLYADYDYSTYSGTGRNRKETGRYYKTTILPVGTYEITANVVKGVNDDANPEYQILVAKGEWTVTPKDITNADFNNMRHDTPDPRVWGMGNRFRLNKTYTSNKIELSAEDLTGKFTYREGLVIVIPGDLTQEEQEEEINKQTGFYYGNLTLGEDFEITSYTNNTDAGTATFHVKGINNFKGEKDMSFTINKANIYVFPTIPEGGNVWAVGSKTNNFQVDWNGKKEVEVAPGVSVPTGINYQLHAFEQDRLKDMTKEDGFKALKVKLIVGATVGEYEAGIKTYAENDEKAKNYNFIFQTAPLTIVQGTILLAVDDVEVTYSGSDKPKYTPTFKVANGQDLDPALEQNWGMVADKEKTAGLKFTDNLTKVDGRYPAGEYTITCTAFPEGTYETINYKFALATTTGANQGTLTVNPAEATLEVFAGTGAVDRNTIVVSYQQFINGAEAWNNDHPTEPKTAEDVKAEFIAGIGAVQTDAEGKVTGNKNIAITGMQKGDVSTDLVKSVVVDDENNIIITAQDNDNYEFTIINGKLVIGATDDELILISEYVEYWQDQWGDYTDGKVSPEFPFGHDLPEGAEPVVKNGGDLAKIKAFNMVPVKAVKITLKPATLDPADETYSQWKAGEWHTMVLPFATTVGDIAYNFGYAIVNVVDEEATNASTKPNEVHFKLQEIMDEIPANTPFCIKSQFDFDYTKPLVFGNTEGALNASGEPILIEYDAKPSVNAGKTFTFEGTYDKMIIDKNTPTYKFLGPNNRWKQFSTTSTSKYTLQPYSGYVNLQGFTGTREVTFFFEEEDGSTTAINAAELQKKSVEGLYRVDGIKLQSAPTQKGVYIQDGKKFVK